jgi:hypothetical protein
LRTTSRPCGVSPCHCAEDIDIAVEMVTAFNVEHGGDFALMLQARKVATIERESELCVCLVQLIKRVVNAAERLLGFVATRVVLLGHVDGGEEGVNAAFLCTRQIPLTGVDAIGDVTTVIELSLERVHVAVEHIRAAMQSGCVCGDCAEGGRGQRGFRSRRRIGPE